MKKGVLACVAVALLLGLAAAAVPAQSDKPVLVVSAFTAKSEVPWPYDLPGLQRKIIAALQKKYGDKVMVVDKAPAGAQVFTFSGVIDKNFTQRDTDAQGNSDLYSEIAEIQYTLTGPDGKKWIDGKKRNFQTNTDPHNPPDAASPGPLAGQITNDMVGDIVNSKAFPK